MRLSEIELRPGVIIDIVNEYGDVKATVPGLFEDINPDNLPPIKPWSIGSTGSFSKPKIGQSIWVMFNCTTTDPSLLFWLCRNDIKETSSASQFNTVSPDTINPQTSPNAEILANKSTSDGGFNTMFCHDSGWVIKNSEGTTLEIDDNKIKLSNTAGNSGAITIDNDIVYIGDSDLASHPVARGDATEEMFNNILNTLCQLSAVAKTSPYTAHLGTIIDQSIKQYNDDTASIPSKTILIQ